MERFDLRLWPGFAAAGGDTSAPAIVEQISIDSRRIDSNQSLFVALRGTLDGHNFVSHAADAGCRYALVQKGWQPPSLPGHVQLLFVPDPLKAFQEIARAYRLSFDIPVIAITGSYGKTMVKDLLHEMLSRRYSVAASPESFNSQIGVPLSLLTIHQTHEAALIEAAFSKPDEMEALATLIKPTSAILTHIGRKHMSTMGSEEAIACDCAKLLKEPGKESWVIVPDDALLDPHKSKIDAAIHCWSTSSPKLPHAHFLPATQDCRVTFRVDFPDGNHHIGRVTGGFYYFLDLINMTVKAAWLMGIPSEDISATLTAYTPEPMRTEIWKSPTGATFINDTYCSDPQSVDVALKHFELAPPGSRKIFVFHGIKGSKKEDLTSYRRIGHALSKAHLDQLMLVGNHHFEGLIKEIKRHGSAVKMHHFQTLPQAFESLKNSLEREDVVLIKGESKLHLDLITEAFNDSITNNQCVINLAAIGYNINVIKKKLPPGTRMMVMVKALAYGTDDVRMANFLTSCGIDILGVSYVDEGVALKRTGITTNIFVINAGLYEAAKIVKWDLEVGVSELGLIEALEREGREAGRKTKVHLHVNTGMSRLGCRPEDALALAQRIVESPHLELEGVMSHFASSEDPAEDAFTCSQAQILSQVIVDLSAHGIEPRWKHAANSSGVLRFNFPQFNMVRIGLAVYGLHASEASRQSMELRLAFSLISRIVGINVCKAGETVSYGRSYRIAREEQRIAVLPIGYFDGLHRNYSGKGHVIIRGRKAPMVGRITMDYMMVDVTDIPHASIGDPVLLFGEDEYGHFLSPEDFAAKVDSIPHELITCLGPRIQRVFVYEEAYQKNNTPGVHHGTVSETA